MVSHVDEELGRVWATLEHLGQWDDTFIVVTSDHAEQLGDQGLIGKLGFFEDSYHIPGIVRHRRHPEQHGRAVNRFTESVDMLPTVCEAVGIPIPAQCDGLPLTPFLIGEVPAWWPTEAHWEFDWRLAAPDMLVEEAPGWPGDEGWTAATWRCCGPRKWPTSSSETVPGWVSTWRGTPRGERRATIPRASTRSPPPCWPGGRSTPNAR